MMKQIIALLFCMMSLSMALRRSSPMSQPSLLTNKDLHRMGWGLDEEYIQRTEDGKNFETVQEVTRKVVKQEKPKCQSQRNWGVRHVCDVEEMLGE